VPGKVSGAGRASRQDGIFCPSVDLWLWAVVWALCAKSTAGLLLTVPGTYNFVVISAH